jgi:hypothetical protein
VIASEIAQADPCTFDHRRPRVRSSAAKRDCDRSTARSHTPSTGVNVLTQSTLADAGTIRDSDTAGTSAPANSGWTPISLLDALRPYSKNPEELEAGSAPHHDELRDIVPTSSIHP